MFRLVALGLVTAACGCIAVAILGAMACITAPPPELPEVTGHRPTILHDAVQPPEQILAELPARFVIPVELDDPNESFEWDVFVDYDPCADPASCQATPERQPPGVVTVTPTPGTLDGGVELIGFDSFTDLTTTQCHRIDVLVAHAFQQNSPRTPDSVGGDIVTWFYSPGGVSCGALVYDAGSFQDGAFPLPDGGSEGGLPVVPESGTGDP